MDVMDQMRNATVRVNQSLTHVNLGLFVKQPEQSGQAITDAASEKMQDRASSYALSRSIVLDGIYSDPRPFSQTGPVRSAVTDRVFAAMKSLQGNAFKNLEAVYHDAVQAETGRDLAAGERLSAGEWQSMSGDLRRSGAEVNLLRVQLAVANGDFKHAGSIGFPDHGTPSDTPEEAGKMFSSMADFRSLQIQNVLTKMEDGSLRDLAEKLGGPVNPMTDQVSPLSKEDLQTLRDDLFADMVGAYQHAAMNG